MSFNNIMLDLETMSVSKDAAIVAIGAVRFNLENGEIDLADPFYRIVNLKSAVRAGGKMDPETVLWWMGQSEEARKELTGDNSILVETALKEFNDWIHKTSIEGVWGNGSDFDNVILENTYLRLGWTPPWTYRMNRCYKTIRALHPKIERDVFIGTQHNAIDDAISQTRHLLKIFLLRAHTILRKIIREKDAIIDKMEEPVPSGQ